MQPDTFDLKIVAKLTQSSEINYVNDSADLKNYLRDIKSRYATIDAKKGNGFS